MLQPGNEIKSPIESDKLPYMLRCIFTLQHCILLVNPKKCWFSQIYLLFKHLNVQADMGKVNFFLRGRSTESIIAILSESAQLHHGVLRWSWMWLVLWWDCFLLFWWLFLMIWTAPSSEVISLVFWSWISTSELRYIDLSSEVQSSYILYCYLGQLISSEFISHWSSSLCYCKFSTCMNIK